VIIEHQNLDGADFSGRRFLNFTAVASAFVDCRFDRSTFKQACFGGGTGQSSYLRCSFDQTRITAVAPGNARFERCNFSGSVLTEFFAHDVEMIGCSFSGTFKKGLLHGRPLEPDVVGRSQNSFYDNDFRAMDLQDVSFRNGIDLDRQLLPSGPPYLFVPSAENAVAEARADVLAWRDLEARRAALAILQGLESDVEGGQRQLLYRADTFGGRMRKAAEAVAELLARHAAQQGAAAAEPQRVPVDP
jgi:uncharacterized protein YjbI with pentapeptide repeats